MSNQVEMFSSLRGAGVHSLYRRTAEILKQRGFSVSMVYDPYTGAVDTYGAMLLAAGADTRNLQCGDDDPVSCGMPEANIKQVVLGVEYFEAMSGLDVSECGKSHGAPWIINYLGMLADRIEIAVIPDMHFKK